MAKEFITLPIDQIKEINRQVILSSPGDGLFGERELQAVEYIQELVQYGFYGEMPFKTVLEKTAAIAHKIIEGHVFLDGNKRTGMIVCETTLELNGYELQAEAGELEDVSLLIAQGQMNVADFAEWLIEKTEMF